MITRLHLFSPACQRRIETLQRACVSSERDTLELRLLQDLHISENAARIAELDANQHRTLQECRELDLLLDSTMATARRIRKAISLENRETLSFDDKAYLCTFYLSRNLKINLFANAYNTAPIYAALYVAVHELSQCFSRYQQMRNVSNKFFTPIEDVSEAQKELIIFTLLRYFSWRTAPEYSLETLQALTGFLKQKIYTGGFDVARDSGDDLLQHCFAYPASLSLRVS